MIICSALFFSALNEGQLRSLTRVIGRLMGVFPGKTGDYGGLNERLVLFVFRFCFKTNKNKKKLD